MKTFHSYLKWLIIVYFIIFAYFLSKYLVYVDIDKWNYWLLKYYLYQKVNNICINNYCVNVILCECIYILAYIICVRSVGDVLANIVYLLLNSCAKCPQHGRTFDSKIHINSTALSIIITYR